MVGTFGRQLEVMYNINQPRIQLDLRLA